MGTKEFKEGNMYRNIFNSIQKNSEKYSNLISGNRDLFIFNNFKNLLSERIKYLYEFKKTSKKKLEPKSVLLLMSLYTIQDILFHIDQNIVENYNYDIDEVEELLGKIAGVLNKLSKDLENNSTNQLDSYKIDWINQIGELHEIYYDLINDKTRKLKDLSTLSDNSNTNNHFIFKANNQFLISGVKKKFNFSLESALTDNEDIDNKIKFLVEEYSKKVEDVLENSDLLRSETKLVFVQKQYGPVGALLLEPLLVQKLGMKASIVIMRWQNLNSRIIGYVPQPNDNYILIYDLNYTATGILEIKETIEANGANLKAAVILWNYQTNFKRNLKDVDIYTIFSHNNLESLAEITKSDLLDLAPLEYHKVKLSEIRNKKALQKENICNSCTKISEIRVMQLPNLSTIKVNYCNNCKIIYVEKEFEGQLTQIKHSDF